MEWRDEGIVLYTRPLGERSHLVSVLTHEHGKENGAARLSKKDLPLLEMGTCVSARWKARLETQLGFLTLEMQHPTSAFLLDDALGLRLLQCAAVMTYMTLPQGHPYPHLYDAFLRLLKALTSPQKLQAFIQFEITLLQELGFGLDLKRCAVTGTSDNLVAVSPKTGRAVSHGPAQPYLDRLLPLPTFLTSVTDDFPPLSEILKALDLTRYFLERYLLSSLSLEMPKVRGELKRFLHRFGERQKEIHYAS